MLHSNQSTAISDTEPTTSDITPANTEFVLPDQKINLNHLQTATSSYQKRYQHSIEDNNAFWRDEAGCVEWIKPFTTVKDVSYDPNNFKIEWFAD